MSRFASLLVVLVLAAACAAPDAVRPPAERSAVLPYRAPSHADVRLADGFWHDRLERNRTVTLPHVLRQNEATGRVANFERAARSLAGEPAGGAYEGRRFNDTDVYKAIEAASYVLAAHPDPALEAAVDRLVELIAAAQEEDGYLVPGRTVDPESPAPGLGEERWIHVSAGSHELYNAGHLIEAAVAHREATGKRAFLDVASRFADRIDADFGPDARRAAPGHEEIELALVRLAAATGEERYRELARFFLAQRGREHDDHPYPDDTPFAIYNDLRYRQDHQPVAEQAEAVGHAVRATYLYAAMSDVGGYEEALERVWTDLVSTKLYLTGGIGSRGTFESFGEPYELPDRTAYTETCAAIGNELVHHRRFLATGEARYLDVMERVLYNGLLSGVSIAGDRFFYTNPLASDGGVERVEYFEVACCPANLARTLARLPRLTYAAAGDEIAVTLYAAGEAELTTGAGPVRVVQRTDYPWSGEVALTLHPARPAILTLAFHIPGWAREEPVPSDLYRFTDRPAPVPTLHFGDREVELTPGRHPVAGGEVVVADGFARIRHRWREGDEVVLSLPMPVRRVAAHPRVESAAGRVALQRGPLVYAVEGVDHGGRVTDLVLPAESELGARWRPDLLGGVTVVAGIGGRESPSAGPEATSEPVTLTAVPYFAWANRDAGEMRVWLPAR